MCPPGHAEWGVCLLLEQVVCLTGTRQMAVCDESCRVGGPGWGGVGGGGQRELVMGDDVDQLRIGLKLVVETMRRASCPLLPSPASCSLPGS